MRCIHFSVPTLIFHYIGNVKFTNEWKGHIIDQFFSFSQKKNLHKVFNKQKKYNRSPQCAAAEPKFVHISSSEEVK